MTWLRRVEAKLGVTPMVYTYPSFWAIYMGDSNWIAKRYGVLWIAHWNTEQPWVPARTWHGNSWTFWQWTDCGTVPGISGCVDRNALNGPHGMRWYTIARTQERAERQTQRAARHGRARR
jgi:lysozyme